MNGGRRSADSASMGERCTLAVTVIARPRSSAGPNRLQSWRGQGGVTLEDAERRFEARYTISAKPGVGSRQQCVGWRKGRVILSGSAKMEVEKALQMDKGPSRRVIRKAPLGKACIIGKACFG